MPSRPVSTNGYSSSTTRDTSSRRLYITSAREISTSPSTQALTMFHRSGTLAKRHSPRYRPTCQNTSPWATSTIAISVDHSGNAGASGTSE
jgi:hypothetical protein